jgi:hypothetical protein
MTFKIFMAHRLLATPVMGIAEGADEVGQPVLERTFGLPAEQWTRPWRGLPKKCATSKRAAAPVERSPRLPASRRMARLASCPSVVGVPADEVDGRWWGCSRCEQIGEGDDPAGHVVDVREVEGVVRAFDAQLLAEAAARGEGGHHAVGVIARRAEHVGQRIVQARRPSEPLPTSRSPSTLERP